MDMATPEALQELLAGGGEGLLGPPSAALQAATGRLEALLALTAGYTLVIGGRALCGRLPRAGARGATGGAPPPPGRLPPGDRGGGPWRTAPGAGPQRGPRRPPRRRAAV